MPTDGSDPVALVFPGQGAQGTGMLDPVSHAPGFAERVEHMVDLLGFDPVASDDPNGLNENAVSSLLTVVASQSALALWRAASDRPIEGVAGYSVGQWTALNAAGVIDEASTRTLVFERARLMDAALSQAPATGMLAVIGIKAETLSCLCADVSTPSDTVAISNENAPGQVTLSGTLAALDAAEAAIRAAHKPKRLVRLPVAGAWHGPFMTPAVAPLTARLDRLSLAPPVCPVIDNVTGDFLEVPLDRARLAAQVAAPVKWMQGVRALIEAGATEMIEVGYGDVLTRFGFFINRRVRHTALHPMPRVA